jgi:hypothetical protein
MIDLARVNPATFQPHVGSDFTVEAAGQSVALRLVEVVDDGIAHGLHQFSLFFHGPADRVLPASIHRLDHHALGTMELFVVPVVGSTAERILYQACFSVWAPEGPFQDVPR